MGTKYQIKMKPISLIAIIALFAFTAGVGFYAGRITSQPTNGYFVDTSNVIYFSPTQEDNAHTMSARFRRDAGWCPGEATCGVFEFSEETANDLMAAVAAIKREVTVATGRAPKFYRCVFGVDAQGRTRLIVAALDASNNEYPASVKIIDGVIPCPKLCDINNSSIIMGPGLTKNPCQ